MVSVMPKRSLEKADKEASSEEERHGVPRWRQIEIMRVGLDQGYIPSAVTLDGVAGQIQSQIIKDSTTSQFYTPFQNVPKTISGPKPSPGAIAHSSGDLVR